MLNPVEPFAAPCRALGVELIVDAMSSYAGVPIDIARVGADYLVSSANKCIQAMAGVSFAICRRSCLERMRVPPGRSYYLNLREQQRFFEKEHQMRFTPPVQLINALARALEEYFDEGREQRWARYQACFAALDSGVRALGFRRLLPDCWLSKILTAYVEPDHPAYSYDGLHDALFARGFTIYPGKGAKQATFRLANMGAITPEDMRAFVGALAEAIDALGLRPLYAAPEQRS
jgi:2-aminoethylphosphonate-pyruvate transaminase